MDSAFKNQILRLIFATLGSPNEETMPDADIRKDNIQEYLYSINEVLQNLETMNNNIQSLNNNIQTTNQKLDAVTNEVRVIGERQFGAYQPISEGNGYYQVREV